MSPKTLLLSALMILLGIGIGYLIWEAPLANTSDEDANGNTFVHKDTSSIPVDSSLIDSSNSNNEELSEGNENSNTDGQEVGRTTENTDNNPSEDDSSAPPANNVSIGSSGLLASGYPAEDDFSLFLTLYSEKLERDTLWYDNQRPQRLQDCSGIFHRIKERVSKKYVQFNYPPVATARHTRALARWYHDNGQFIIITDPKKQKDLIRPGSVMFFGESGKRYTSMTIEQLSSDNPRGYIRHIGVITELVKDKQGETIGYVMMHGRRPGVYAQRTHYHKVDPPRAGFPVLGNWNQQWVAIADIMAK